MAKDIKMCDAKENEYQMVHTQADTIVDERSISELVQDVKRGQIRDDMSRQRDANQFAPKFKTLLIHTVLANLYIPPIELVQGRTGAGAVQELIDGKQRLSTFVQFLNNEWKLSSVCPPIRMSRVVEREKLDDEGNVIMNIPEDKRKKPTPVMEVVLDEHGNPVTEEFDYKIAGKYFCQLPEAVQMHIKRYKLMKQTIHINYSEHESELQMIRSNMSVKMTPAQVGMVVCGEALASWLRKFREHDLFLNNTFWKEKTEINKSLIERCVIEAYVLSILEDSWSSSYPKNVELFKENATEDYLKAFMDVVDDFNSVVKLFPSLKDKLTKDNIHILMAAYTNFRDFDTRYSKVDFGKFLIKWFNEIKDETEYEVEGNIGTKQKTTVIGKVAIVTEECRKYMEEYGRIVGENPDEDMSETALAEDMLKNFVEDFGDEERVALRCLAEIDSRTIFKTNFKEENTENYRNFFTKQPNAELIEKCLVAQDAILSINISEDNQITNEYNLPILIRLYNENVHSDAEFKTFCDWLKAFDDCTDVVDVEIAGMTFDSECGADVEQTSNGTIRNKYAILERSLRDYANINKVNEEDENYEIVEQEPEGSRAVA